MYGLVNKALQDFVCRHHGEETWTRIRQRAGIKTPTFIGMQSYPDEVTYALVGAASAELSQPAGDLLERFGEHWMVFTAVEGYGDLLRCAGTNYIGFLSTLNAMHARLRTVFPALKPPEITVSDATATTCRLQYRSERPGLARFVVGLLKGLGRLYQVDVDVAQVGSKDSGAPCDEFTIATRPAHAASA